MLYKIGHWGCHPRKEETHAYILNEIQLLLRDNVDPAAKVLQCGSGYRRRLMFKRSWVWIPEPEVKWIIFTSLCCENDIVVWKDWKWTERGREWPILKKKLYNTCMAIFNTCLTIGSMWLFIYFYSSAPLLDLKLIFLCRVASWRNRMLSSEKKPEKRFSMNFLDTLGAGDPLSWENTMKNSGASNGADRDKYCKTFFGRSVS